MPEHLAGGSFRASWTRVFPRSRPTVAKVSVISPGELIQSPECASPISDCLRRHAAGPKVVNSRVEISEWRQEDGRIVEHGLDSDDRRRVSAAVRGQRFDFFLRKDLASIVPVVSPALEQEEFDLAFGFEIIRDTYDNRALDGVDFGVNARNKLRGLR